MKYRVANSVRPIFLSSPAANLSSTVPNDPSFQICQKKLGLSHSLASIYSLNYAREKAERATFEQCRLVKFHNFHGLLCLLVRSSSTLSENTR